MKKLIAIIIAVLLAAVAAFAVYRFALRKSIPEAPVEEQVAAILTQNDCYVCHSSEPRLPFYASFPVIGPQMDEHVLHAQRFLDLDKATKDMSDVSEVTLAMIEHAVRYGTMPISQYKMIHWGTGFNNKEKSILMQWVADQRAERFNNTMAGSEFVAEPVRPVPTSVQTDPAIVALGEKMYNDTRISLDGTISCASCHILDKGGVSSPDHRTSEGIYGQFGGVNAPTVYNAVFNVRQFWNGRAADLREQAAGPPANPVEMGDQTWDDIVARLRKDKALVAEFNKLYPGEGLTERTVTSAIAEFEKTLLTPGSAFDLYLMGEAQAISEEQKAGYELFKASGCANCHVGTILGGQSFEYLSIYGDYFADRDTSIAYGPDDDGLKGFTGNDADLQKFKVPTLRNVELTAPYFHDGSIATMEDAVRAMAKYELGKQLSDSDVNSLVSFMKSLTGNGNTRESN